MFREFVEDAKSYGAVLQNSNAELEREIQELTDRLEIARTKQENIPVQMERAAGYEALGNQLACPRCYVENGQENNVITQAGGDDGGDRFLCRVCRYEQVTRI